VSKFKGKILIVDDEIYIQEILLATLGEEGYECMAVGEAVSALETLAGVPVDLALLDIRMPGMSGTDLLQEVRSRFPDVVVVMITAVDSAAAAAEAIRLGAYDYVVKPFNLEQVILSANRAMEKRRLEDSRREYQRYLEQVAEERSAETRRLFYSVTQVLIGLLEVKAPYRAGALKRVAEMSRYVARELRLTEDGVRKVYLAALLHDVGMILVEDLVSSRGASLTAEEHQQVRIHAAMAEQILRPILGDEEVLKCIRHHHERFDGSGYPDGLKGNIIPLGARIISVVGAFAAMTRARPYRPAMTPRQAFAELRRCSGTQFDPQVVGVFADLHDKVLHNMDRFPQDSP
jgi:response regulator RpfG family c-di-GMP phosphodiesterase